MVIKLCHLYTLRGLKETKSGYVEKVRQDGRWSGYEGIRYEEGIEIGGNRKGRRNENPM